MTKPLDLSLEDADFHCEAAGPGEPVTLHFENAAAHVAVRLSPENFNKLIRQGQAAAGAALPLTEIAQARTEAVRRLQQLDDAEWPVLLREVDTEVLVELLWFLKDRGIAAAVMRNFNQRAAALLADDLMLYRGRDPDHAGPELIRHALAALAGLFAQLDRRLAEGAIALTDGGGL